MLTASGFRTDIYRILDSVVETGESIEIEHRVRILRISVTPPLGSKLSRIRKRPGLINGNPKDLAEIDRSKEWNPDGNS